MTRLTLVRKPIGLTDPDLVIVARPDAEDLPIEGNALGPEASEVEARAEENRIAEESARGNPWAWCMATVRVTYRGVLWAEAHRVGCSFRDEDEFREDPLFADMVASNLVEINKMLDVLCGPKGGK